MELNQRPWYLSTNLWNKELKLHNGRKKASSTYGVGITGCQPVEKWK